MAALLQPSAWQMIVLPNRQGKMIPALKIQTACDGL